MLYSIARLLTVAKSQYYLNPNDCGVSEGTYSLCHSGNPKNVRILRGLTARETASLLKDSTRVFSHVPLISATRLGQWRQWRESGVFVCLMRELMTKPAR